MYTNPQIIIPNYYQLDQLPFIKVDQLNQQSGLSVKRMLSVRNFTYKYQNLTAKIFGFWPSYQIKGNSSLQYKQYSKIVLVTEIAILPLDNLSYVIADLLQKQQISQQQINILISQIEQFKQQISTVVDNLMMAEYQIKMSNSKNVSMSVYYNPYQDCFRLKLGLKSLAFQISPLLKKNKIVFDTKEGFVIKNQTVISILKKKLQEKLINLQKRNYDKDTICNYNKKMEEFYIRDIKIVDQNLLQLKLKYNFPTIRQKRFFPIQFNDGFDGQKLVDPIFSNKNKHCMFGHFTGYNNANFSKLQRTLCQFCGIQIKQMQENKLLMFLRENIFNPSNESILYCPQFNRFKIHHQISQLQLTRRKIAQMKIEQQIKQPCPQFQIRYLNYMHLCLSVKNMYAMTKNRIKMQYRKEVETVDYVYSLYNKANKNKNNKNEQQNQIYQYFLNMELCDPARGKFCSHLEFADLRLYYINRKNKVDFMLNQKVYICPICDEQVKDTELIYLKQALVLIKYINKMMQPMVQDEFQMKPQKQSQIIKKSIKIKINNVQKKVFIEFEVEQKNSTKKQITYIQNLYQTLVDPYISFSDYELNLHRKNRAFDAEFNFEGEKDLEILQRKKENQWLGTQQFDFVI